MIKNNSYKEHIQNPFRAFGAMILLICLFALPSSPLIRAAGAAESIGKITAAEGKVDILREGALPAVAAKAGDGVFLKDIIRTKSDSKAEILFTDGSVLKLAQRSRIDLSEYVSGNKGLVKLSRGKVEAIVPPKLDKGTEDMQKAKRFEIHTPSAVAGVRGTDYIVFHDRYTSGVVVKEGIVYVYNPKFPDIVTVINEGSSITVPFNAPPMSPAKGAEGVQFGFERIEGGIPHDRLDTQLPVTPPPHLPTKQGDFQRIDGTVR